MNPHANQVLPGGAEHRRNINPVMAAEVLVLYGDRRQLELVRNLIEPAYETKLIIIASVGPQPASI